MAEHAPRRHPSPEGPSDALTPDEIEQRQRPDGAVEDPGTVDEPTDEALTPDELEQRRIVEDDEDDAPPE